MHHPRHAVATIQAACGAIVLLLLLATSTALLAQAPDNGTPTLPFDSPLTAPAPTATWTATATPTLTPTPTQDLSSAVLQVSPLRVAPNDRPLNNTGAMLWLVAALALVFAGAVVMAIKK
ncbi:MAG TPA: hypothetical protein GX400_19115 [Chloroflexi bacterium]|nr:hypothetical protein [Chloroflexota bacterium]